MRYPLYREVSLSSDLTRANKSLIFDKFYAWDELGGELKDQDKTTNLKKLISGGCGDSEAIERHCLASVELIEALQGQWKVFKNEWHFITGMGNDHPLENGMAWHHTLGTPYLAGSGLKGLLRAYCEVWAEWEQEKIERCFGKAAQSKEETAEAGEYIFFDAIPTRRPTLTSDVMTPHMGKWYEKGGETPHDFDNTPGDWHTPVPVTFLAVKDISLLFAIARCPGRGSDEELNELMQALEEALEWVGAGAKTAAGYGRFEKDQARTKSLEDSFKTHIDKKKNDIEISSMTPLEKKIEELRQSDRNTPKTTLILNNIKNGNLKEFQCEALRLLKKLMVENKEWKETTNAKKPEKDQKYKRTQEVIQMFRECKGQS